MSIVVSSVSCIYGLGAPEEYMRAMVALQVGEVYDRDALIRKFIAMQYNRNDVDFSRGNFRVRGDTIEIIPIYEEYAIRIELFGDEIEALYMLHPLTGDVVQRLESVPIFPASHYVAGTETVQRAIGTIEDELAERLKELESQNKLLEAQRLRMRTTFDLEMLQQLGFCSGIENYSRHLDGRAPGEAPHTLLDFFPDDFLMVIDESHVTVPQIGAMYEGDASRKRTLVEHGFRLPSALDNRPLRWDEFKNRVGQTVYLSATPGRYEMGIADGVVEQIIRPTGLVDPQIVVKPSKGQIDDLLEEIRRARRARRARARHDAHEEDGGGAHRLPRRARRAGALPALGCRHPAPRGAAERAARRRLRRARRHQPAARGPRPARGLAGVDPGCRQGGLPPQRHVAHPDDRPRRPQRLGRGAHVRRHGHRLDAQRDRRDRPAPREAGRLQPRRTASTRSRCASASPTSPRCSRARHPTPTRCCSRKSSAKLKSGKGKAPTPQLRRTGIAAEGAEQLEATIADLSNQMLAAAGELKFELAARLRDEVQDMKKELRAMERAGPRLSARALRPAQPAPATGSA